MISTWLLILLIIATGAVMQTMASDMFTQEQVFSLTFILLVITMAATLLSFVLFIVSLMLEPVHAWWIRREPRVAKEET